MNINPRNRPHDYFFRRTFDSAEHTRDLIRTFLPAPYLEGLQLDQLQREKESFLSPADAESMLDLLYSARYADGTRVVIYFLMEHKSPDMNVVFIDLLQFPTDQFQGSQDFLARMRTLPNSKASRKQFLPGFRQNGKTSCLHALICLSSSAARNSTGN